MDHAEARRLIEAAADGILGPEASLDLEAHLAACSDCRRYAAELQELESGLRAALKARYPEVAPDPAAQAGLQARFQAGFRRPGPALNIQSFAWGALSLALVLALVWSIRTLIPAPVRPGVAVTPAATPLPSRAPGGLEGRVTPEAAVFPPTTTPASPDLAEGNSRPVELPGIEFQFAVPLPESPGQAPLFVQDLPELANLEAIQAVAARFDLDGPVFERPGEGMNPVYEITDGYRRLVFPYGLAEVFVYTDISRDEVVLEWGEPGDDFARAQAVSFLQARGLLGEDYTVELLPGEPGGVHIVRAVDGAPVYSGIGYSPTQVDLLARVDGAGVVRALYYSPQDFTPVGDFPLISAREAWEAFLAGSASGRIRYAIYDDPDLRASRTWVKTIKTNEPVDIYAYPNLLRTDDGEAGYAWLGDYPPVGGELTGAFIAQVSPYDFVHAWGQFKTSAEGQLFFDLAGWEIIVDKFQAWEGVLEKRDQELWLVTETQGELLLNRAPEDVVLGERVLVSGLPTGDGGLDWNRIQTLPRQIGVVHRIETCGGGGGGGGGGATGATAVSGGDLAQVSLVPDRSAPGSNSPPGAGPDPSGPFGAWQSYRPGDRIETATGEVFAARRTQADGTQPLEVTMLVVPPAGSPESRFISLRLAGELVEQIASLSTLPVRIWGEVTGYAQDGAVLVQVERFEEVYPGLRVQAWLGTWQIENLEDRDVIVFTSTDGEEFVLKHSTVAAVVGDFVGREGDPVILEGVMFPDESYAGYPVVVERMAGQAGDRTDLTGYVIESVRPSLLSDLPSGQDSRAETLEGIAIVERIELAYLAASLRGCAEVRESDPDKAPWLIVQPIWRFTGTLKGGQMFEIQVQALPSEYLR